MLALVILALAAAACAGEPASSEGDLGSDGSDSVIDLTPEPDRPVDIFPTATPEGPRPIVIATLLGETGVMAPVDGPALAGVAARIDQLNAEGGLLGRPIELRRFDTNSRVSVAARTIGRLIEEKPDLLIVSCDVEFSTPVLEAADAAGLLTLSPCADDPAYATGALGPRNFTFGAPATGRGALAARIALDRYGSTAMVLRDVTNPESLEFCDGFERSFRDLGGTVTYRDEFSYDTLEPVQERLADGGRQTSFIVVCSHVPGGVDAAPSIIAMLRTLGFQAPLLAGVSLDEPTWLQAVPVLGELMLISWSSVHGNDPVEWVNEIVDRANADSDTPRAGMTTVLGAEAIDAWAQAVEAVRNIDPGPVAAALGSFSEVEFATGRISFVGGARMDIDRHYRVLQVSAGEVSVTDVVEVDG